MLEFIGKTTEVEYVEKPRIDLKDMKILTVLSKNCRLQPTQISKIVGLSKEVVYYRIRNLEKKGFIRGYVTIINPAKIGFQIFIVCLQTQNLSEAKEKELTERLISHPSTHYIARCLGKYDLAFDILARSIGEFDNILRELLKGLDDVVKNYEISPILDVIKYTHLTDSFSKDLALSTPRFISDSSFSKELANIKIDYTPSKVNLDEKDLQILYYLSNNAALQLKQIEEKTKISSDTIKYRIRKLIEQNVIIGFLPIINISLLGYHTYAIFISLNNINFTEKNKILNHLAAHPDVFFCLKTSGQYEIILNINITSNLHLHRFINELKQNYPQQIKTIEMSLVIKDYKITFLPPVQ